MIKKYLTQQQKAGGTVAWSRDSAPGNEEVKLLAMRVKDSLGEETNLFSSSRDLYVEMEFEANTKHTSLCVGFDLMLPSGDVVARSYHTDMSEDKWPHIQSGRNSWVCRIPARLLNAGVYYVSPRIGMHNLYWIVNIDMVLRFELLLDHGVSPFWNDLTERNRPGIIAQIFDWKKCP